MGNGTAISMWKDNWLNGKNVRELALPNVDTNTDIKVNSLITNQQWDRHKIEQFFGRRGLNHILAIQLPLNNIRINYYGV